MGSTLQGGGWTKEQNEKVMQQFDKNGDKLIDLQEFLDFYHKMLATVPDEAFEQGMDKLTSAADAVTKTEYRRISELATTLQGKHEEAVTAQQEQAQTAGEAQASLEQQLQATAAEAQAKIEEVQAHANAQSERAEAAEQQAQAVTEQVREHASRPLSSDTLMCDELVQVSGLHAQLAAAGDNDSALAAAQEAHAATEAALRKEVEEATQKGSAAEQVEPSIVARSTTDSCGCDFFG